MPFSVRSGFSTLTAEELCASPASALIGVQPATSQLLAQMGIQTIGDLASSMLFGTATLIVSASGNPVPRDRLSDIGASLPPFDLADSTIGHLRLLESPALRQDVETLLGVASIRDLSLWPPYLVALAIEREANGIVDLTDANDGAPPADLVPVSGKYPIERVQYEVLVLDQTDLEEGIDLLGAGQIKLTETEATYPVQGALLTWTQSWYTRGLGLGQLLHSLALAPGESTRIAMIDWQRRQQSNVSEGISENEALTSDLGRTRSINEVTRAVATEAQSGFSNSVNNFEGGQIGGAMGGSVAGGYGGEGFSIQGAGGHGVSAGYAKGTSDATSISWTTGQRDISASLAQQITDRTHQASSSARGRWATLVREVTQSESEKITTRAVTNFNHMHALTVQYWETVQLYRVSVELTNIDAALFIPMAPLVFDIATVQKYRQQIAAAALIPEIRALADAEPGWVAVSSPNRTPNLDGTVWGARYIDEWQRALGVPIGAASDSVVTLPLAEINNLEFGCTSNTLPMKAARVYWRGGTMTQFNVADMEAGHNAWSPQFRAVVGDLFNLNQPNGVPISDIRKITFLKRDDVREPSGLVEFMLTIGTQLADRLDQPCMALSARIRVPGNAEEFTVFDFEAPFAMSRILAHLNQNREHYSRAIWSGLSATSIFSLLRPYTWKGRPVVSQVDPLPISTAGNYLVFRLHPSRNAQSEAEWAAFLKERDIHIGERKETIVPMPAGGVFAEAVLGRANSAEKLDITRFWNWQDSPIPLLAPEIAAISAGSRAQADDSRPGQLSSPVLNIMNAPAMPDPSGMAGVLAAIQNGNMFRDMSGLAATIAAAQSGLSRGFDASTAAAAQAGENFKTAADLLSNYMNSKVAAAPTGGGSGSGQATNASHAGALINHGRALDQADKDHSAGGRDAGSDHGSFPDSSNDDVTTGAPTAGEPGVSAERAAFESLLPGGGAGGTTMMGKVASMVQDAATGALPVVAGLGAAARSAGVFLAGKVSEQLISSPITIGELTFVGVDKTNVLLRDHDAEDWYFEAAPEQSMVIRIEDLGGSSMLDGVSGEIEVKWTPVQINHDRIKRGFTSTVREEIKNAFFYRNVTVKLGVAGLTIESALESARISAIIETTNADAHVMLVGGTPRSFVNAQVRLEFVLKPASIGGVATADPWTAPVTVFLRPGTRVIRENHNPTIQRRLLVD